MGANRVIKRYLKIAGGVLHGNLWKLNLAVTNQCNSRCLICNVWANPSRNELSVDDYTLLFENLGSKLRWLHLTGGEPFLRSDLGEIIARAQEACPNLSVLDVSTNGFLPNKIRQIMEKAVNEYPEILFEVGVSMDGRRNIHERIRNVDGCWEKTQATWNNLKSLSLKYRNFRVHANFTINPWNIGELPQFCKEFPQISPISISIYHVGHSFKNTLGSRPDAEFYEKVKEDISWFLRHGKTTNLTKNLFLRLALKYLGDPSTPILPCAACDASCFIDPEGNVYPCTLLEHRLGNIREDRQLSFLSGDSTKELEEKIRNGLCNCWSGCECWSSILKNIPLAFIKAYVTKLS
jgi:radical SAM protein with 4Fe4S-binding SPASM domain